MAHFGLSMTDDHPGDDTAEPLEGTTVAAERSGHLLVGDDLGYQYRCSRARAQHGGPDCQIIGGKRIDQAVVEVFLQATGPCAEEAARLANEHAREEAEALRLYWEHQIEKVRYVAQRAERQYLAVEPENRVVARELERRWEAALQELERVERESEQACAHPALLSADELENVHLLGQELREVWDAESTELRW